MSNLIRNTNNLLDTVFGINDAFIDAHFNAPRPYMSRQQNGQVISKDESWQVVFAVPGVKPGKSILKWTTTFYRSTTRTPRLTRLVLLFLLLVVRSS